MKNKNTDSTPKIDKEITYLVSLEETTKYCNGADMDSDGYRKTISVKKTITPIEKNLTKTQIIKEVIKNSTTGMCNTVMSQLDITENNGTVNIPAFDAWAGVSIAMCSCKPQIEVNLLQIPGINKVVWGSNSGI